MSKEKISLRVVVVCSALLGCVLSMYDIREELSTGMFLFVLLSLIVVWMWILSLWDLLT